MKPVFHPQTVNDPFGDPAVYVEFLFEKRALLFDLGEIQPLPPRKILRLSDVFVSHTHMDHFMGFDRLLRICLGREKQLRLFGPPGFVAQVEHKLAAYTWNLVENYATDFTVVATETDGDGQGYTARFRTRARFRSEGAQAVKMPGGILLDEELFRVRVTRLDHKIPCLAFALEEKAHVNVWKNRLAELGFPTGPWLAELKRAVVAGCDDDSVFRVWWRENGIQQEQYLALGYLKERLLNIGPGQKIAYVVDAVFHPDNAQRIVDLARGADILFIEAGFLSEVGDHAARKFHLTARQAGELGRRAGVARLVPLHFSARHADREPELRRELEEAFAGTSDRKAHR